MKSLIIGVLFSFAGLSVAQAGSVSGYYRNNGTYVAPHYQSRSNGTVTDNYSFKGNTNPYTGTTGTNKYRSNPTSPYFDGSSRSGRRY